MPEEIGCVVIAVAALIVPTAVLAYFYFHVPLVFVLIGILIVIIVLSKSTGVMYIVPDIGCFLYVNLFLLTLAAGFQLFGFTLTEYVILGTLVALNLYLVRIGF